MRWGTPPKYISYEVIWSEMTPEQQDLLRRKCTKRDLYQSHLMRLAIGSAFGGKFTPLDLIDGPISEDGEGSIDGVSPRTRRQQKWGKWEWNDRQLYEYCLERNYDVEFYFEKFEIEALSEG